MRRILFMIFCLIIISSCASDNLGNEIVVTNIEESTNTYTENDIIISSTITESTTYTSTKYITEDEYIITEKIDEDNEKNNIDSSAILAFSLDGINLREDSSFESEVIRKVYSNEKIYILDNCLLYNNFYHIFDGLNYGYMLSDYVFPKETIFFSKENGKHRKYYISMNGFYIDSETFEAADTVNYLSKNEYINYIIGNKKYINKVNINLNISKFNFSKDELNSISFIFNNIYIYSFSSFDVNKELEENILISDYELNIDDNKERLGDLICKCIYSGMLNNTSCVSPEKITHVISCDGVITNNLEYDFIIKSYIDTSKNSIIFDVYLTKN